MMEIFQRDVIALIPSIQGQVEIFSYLHPQTENRLVSKNDLLYEFQTIIRICRILAVASFRAPSIAGSSTNTATLTGGFRADAALSEIASSLSIHV